MAEAMDLSIGDSARSDSRRSKPPTVSRPCPLCGAAINVPEQRGHQSVECGACGLHCSVDASPPRVALDARLLEPIIDVSKDVEHWLERPPQPAPLELTREARRARRRRAAAIGLGSLLSAAIAALAAFVSYQRAHDRFAQRLAEQCAQAAESEAHLLAEKQRLERERQLADRSIAAAERETRLMTARYFAAQAQDALPKRPWHSVTAAIEAMNATLSKDGFVSPEAHQSLRDAIAHCPAAYKLDGVALPGRAGSATRLAASPNGRWLAAAAPENAVRLWDLQQGEPGKAATLLKEHSAPVTHVLFSHDSRYLITGSKNSTASVWELTTDVDAINRVVLPGREGPITKMALSPDGRWLALVFGGKGNAETARLWDLAAGPQHATSLELDGHGRRIQAVAISADSRWLAMGVDDMVHLWDLAASAPAVASVGRQCRHGGVTEALFTIDGTWLVTAGRDGGVRLWNLAAHDPSTSIELRGHHSPVQLLTASPDGRWIITASHDRSLKLWDLHAASIAPEGVELTVSAGAVTAAEISGNGKWLAASAAGAGVYLWALQDDGPDAKAVMIHASGGLCDIAFTSNSRWIAASGDDSAVRLWNVDLPDLIVRASAALARRHSVAFRYVWLDPSQTIAGRVIAGQIDNSAYAVLGRSLARHVGNMQSTATRIAQSAAGRWAEIQPALAQRRADISAFPTVEAPATQPPARPDQAAFTPRTAKSRFELPRRATQGNTLRLYVN
jgi:WD40 repeat protein